MQLLTSRFINTKGRVGCNLPSDLHMEHLNRRLKEIIHHQGSNIKPSSLVTSSRVIGIVDDICKSFESEVRRGKQRSDVHHKPSSVRDLEKIKEELMAKKVFEIIPKRRHNAFSFKKCVLEAVDYQDVRDYIVDKILPQILF